MKSRLFGAICAIVLAVNISSVHATTIFVSGDVTPIFNLTDIIPNPVTAGNQQFFTNILGSSNNVAVLDTGFNGFAVSEANSFYNSLSGVSSTVLGGLSTTSLQNIDFLLLPVPDNEFSATDLFAIDNLLTGGGSVFFLGEALAIPFGETTNSIINNALIALGSGLSLINKTLDIGNQLATGGQIAAQSLTAGITSFSYGATSEVNGGTALLFAQNGDAFVAFESQNVSTVPVPAAAWLFGSALLGVFGFARRKKTV